MIERITEEELRSLSSDLKLTVQEKLDRCFYAYRCNKMCDTERQERCRIAKFWDKYGTNYASIRF